MNMLRRWLLVDSLFGRLFEWYFWRSRVFLQGAKKYQELLDNREEKIKNSGYDWALCVAFCI